MSSPQLTLFSDKSWGESIHGLSISQTDMRYKFESTTGEVPYPRNYMVSPIELLI